MFGNISKCLSKNRCYNGYLCFVVLQNNSRAIPIGHPQVQSKGKYRMFAFGLFPGVCSLNANVSEHSVRSIFLGGYVRNDSGGEM
jgi:hypothetical protein